MLTKTEIEDLMKKPGQVRGVVFVTDAEYILNKKGEKELERVGQKTKEWGHPIDYKNIRNMEWFPIGLRIISLLAAKEVFNWQDKEIEDMGHSAPAYSLVVKLLMKYFLTLKQTYEKSPGYWAKHYNIGKLEAPEYNEKEKYLILQLWDFKIHPILCSYYLGYFRKIAELGAQQKITGIEETKCPFRAGPCHEYTIRWE